MRLLSLALILGVAVGRAAATAEYVVVFSTAEACAVHDMSKAHLILKEPSGGHEGVAASCAPECGGTAMGFLSAECVPPLLEAAGGMRMTLYHTAQGCANEDETDIVRILFNLHDCFTISNGESLTILSSGPEDQEVCSVRMTCTGGAQGHTEAVFSGYDTEDCSNRAVSTHAASSGACVYAEGMGYTRYTCPSVAQPNVVNEDVNVELDLPVTENPESNTDVHLGLFGASLAVVVIAVVFYGMFKK
jgi:hypothetical protein